MAELKELIEDENRTTAISEDENGRTYSETVDHDGSTCGMNNARDEAIERACNH